MDKIFNVRIIKNYMRENTLSKGKFCKKCRIGILTFNKIMLNDSSVGIVAIFKIAKAIGVPVYKLFNKKNPNKK